MERLQSIAASMVLALELAEDKPDQDLPEEPAKKPEKEPLEEDLDVDDPSFLSPVTEYSVQIDLSITADFEGKTTQTDLVKKFKEEMINAIRNGMALTASGLGLTAVRAKVKPIDIQCEINEEFDPE
jgi:hypothetical protein